jgi:hypothetical protein
MQEELPRRSMQPSKLLSRALDSGADVGAFEDGLKNGLPIHHEDRETILYEPCR